MPDETNHPQQGERAAGAPGGCLIGILIILGVPALVLAGNLVSNHFNDQCGTPSDSGG